MAEDTVRQECDERTGEYRENEAAKDRDPLHHSALSTFVCDLLRQEFGGVDGFVLDHGCGSGRVALELARLGVAVALNDISAQAIQTAVDCLASEGLKDRIACSYTGDIAAWHGSTPWSGFVSHRVLHALPPSLGRRAIHALVTGLRPGGRAVISARSSRCVRLRLALEDPLYTRLSEGTFSFVRKEPFKFQRFFEFGEIQDELRAGGLEVLSCIELLEATGNLERASGTETNHYWLAVCRKPS